MYFIVVKFQTKPEWTDRWIDLVGPFTEATRAEPGNKFFEWSRSVDNPHEFVLVEGGEVVGSARTYRGEGKAFL